MTGLLRLAHAHRVARCAAAMGKRKGHGSRLYAVRLGRSVGVYDTWRACSKQVGRPAPVGRAAAGLAPLLRCATLRRSTRACHARPASQTVPGRRCWATRALNIKASKPRPRRSSIWRAARRSRPRPGAGTRPARRPRRQPGARGPRRRGAAQRATRPLLPRPARRPRPPPGAQSRLRAPAQPATPARSWSRAAATAWCARLPGGGGRAL